MTDGRRSIWTTLEGKLLIGIGLLVVAGTIWGLGELLRWAGKADRTPAKTAPANPKPRTAIPEPQPRNPPNDIGNP